jgi:hypothetical protein
MEAEKGSAVVSEDPIMHRIMCLCTLLFFVVTVNAGDGGFESLFNGKDLSGWTGTKEQKEHWRSADGVLLFDGKPSKSRLYTEKTFRDFELVFDWMPSHGTKQTNLRFRGNGEETGEVTGLMTLHPDGTVTVSSPWGATISVEKAKLNAGKWNRVNVCIMAEKVSVRINGKTAIDRFPLPSMQAAPRPISFDGEGAMRICNIYVRELKR